MKSPNINSEYTKLITRIAIIFTALVLAGSFIPFLYDILISVKEYAPSKGLINSPYVGGINYVKLINSHHFSRLLTNTITQSLFFSIFLFFISTAIGYIIITLPIKNIFRNVIITFALALVFIPDVVYVGWFIHLPFVPFTSKPFVTANIAVWFIPFIRAIKYAGIPILMVSILSRPTTQKKVFLLPIQIGACFTSFSLMFIAVNDITITSLVSNPLIYEVIDSFNLFTYRAGLINADYSSAAVVSVMSRLASLISAIIFAIPFIVLAKNSFARDTRDKLFDHAYSSEVERKNTMEVLDETDNFVSNLMSTGIAIGLIFLVGAFPYLTKGADIFGPEVIIEVLGNIKLLGNYPLYIFISFIGACINVGFAAILAYPLVHGGKNLKRISIILLLLIAILASGPVSIGAYILLRGSGLFNTVYAPIFALVFSISGVWAFVAIANLQGVPEEIGYAKAISKPAIALILVQIVYCLNNFLPSLIYISDSRLRSPIIVYRDIAITGGEMARQVPGYDGVLFWYGVILSVIPVGVLAILRTFQHKKAFQLSILGISQRR